MYHLLKLFHINEAVTSVVQIQVNISSSKEHLRPVYAVAVVENVCHILFTVICFLKLQPGITITSQEPIRFVEH